MKLIDQYIYAIGRKLPYNSRKEIQKELNSLLMDELESNFGTEPTEADVKTILADYGSPREVANRYRSNNLVIGSGYTDLFFFIIKIIAFAMSISFTVLFILGLFQGELSASSIIIDIAKTLGRIFNGTLSALGWLTVIFIIITRVDNDKFVDLDEDWTPDELKDIQIGPEGESRLGSALTIFFSLFFIIVINAYPQLITLSERSFSLSGFLGHNVNIDVFKQFLIPLSILWFITIVYHGLNLFYGSKSRNLALLDLFVEIAGAILMILLATNTNLYDNYTSLVGYQSIFIIVAILSTVEALGKCFKFIKYYLLHE